jgi:hypothetical protein
VDGPVPDEPAEQAATAAVVAIVAVAISANFAIFVMSISFRQAVLQWLASAERMRSGPLANSWGTTCRGVPRHGLDDLGVRRCQRASADVWLLPRLYAPAGLIGATVMTAKAAAVMSRGQPTVVHRTIVSPLHRDVRHIARRRRGELEMNPNNDTCCGVGVLVARSLWLRARSAAKEWARSCSRMGPRIERRSCSVTIETKRLTCSANCCHIARYGVKQDKYRLASLGCVS